MYSILLRSINQIYMNNTRIIQPYSTNHQRECRTRSIMVQVWDRRESKWLRNRNRNLLKNMMCLSSQAIGKWLINLCKGTIMTMSLLIDLCKERSSLDKIKASNTQRVWNLSHRAWKTWVSLPKESASKTKASSKLNPTPTKVSCMNPKWRTNKTKRLYQEQTNRFKWNHRSAASQLKQSNSNHKKAIKKQYPLMKNLLKLTKVFKIKQSNIRT